MLNSPINFNDPTGHESVCGQASSDPECAGVPHNPKPPITPPDNKNLHQDNPDNDSPAYGDITLPQDPLSAQPNLDLLANPPPFTCDAYCQSQLDRPNQTSSPSGNPGIAVQIEYLIFNYINDINLSSPLFWRKTFTAGKAINPFPVVDAVVGAGGQGLTDAFNPNLSWKQRGERIGVAGIESFLTGIASDGVGVAAGLAGGGPVGYAGAQMVSSLALDNGFWPKYNQKYFGAAGY